MSSQKIDSLYCLMKGEPGLRKSSSALSFPKPIYFFSVDRKMENISIPMRAWNINPKEVSFDDYDDFTKIRLKLEQFQLNCPFKTLVLDSITSIADVTLRQTTKMKYGQTRKSGAAAGKMIAGIAVNEIEDYNAEAAALQELIALTKDIKSFHKVNIVLIAHVVQAEYRNTTTNETHVSRQIVTAGKKVAPKIPAYCSEVYHFNLDKGISLSMEGEYTCLTRHTGDDYANTALPLPKLIKFGDKPLYDNWILPAINELNGEKPSLRAV